MGIKEKKNGKMTRKCFVKGQVLRSVYKYGGAKEKGFFYGFEPMGQGAKVTKGLE